MTPEGKAKVSVKKALELLEVCGDVLWYERLNSGAVESNGKYIYLCRPGTFDFIAVFQNHAHHLVVAFIEVKRADKKAKYSDTQLLFYNKYFMKHQNIIFLLVQSGDDVKKEILSRCFNRVHQLKM